jgi:hypothetical protein
MAVLSDPDFKSVMTTSFSNHIELLLKTMQSDSYNLIRYSVQVFTSEDMARSIIQDQVGFDRHFSIMEMYMAKVSHDDS